MQKDPPGAPAPSFGFFVSLDFSLFVSLTLSFFTLSCPFAIFEP